MYGFIVVLHYCSSVFYCEGIRTYQMRSGETSQETFHIRHWYAAWWTVVDLLVLRHHRQWRHRCNHTPERQRPCAFLSMLPLGSTSSCCTFAWIISSFFGSNCTDITSSASGRILQEFLGWHVDPLPPQQLLHLSVEFPALSLFLGRGAVSVRINPGLSRSKVIRQPMQ